MSSLSPWAEYFDRLVGERISRVSLDQWYALILSGKASLRTGGDWTLYDPDGNAVDHSLDAEDQIQDRNKFEVWRLVGSTVTKVDLLDTRLPAFSIHTDNGWSLRIESDDSGYESWQLEIEKYNLFIAKGEEMIVFLAEDVVFPQNPA